MNPVPEFNTDAQAEAFLEQDLSGLDFTQFRPMQFEEVEKEASLSKPLPDVDSQQGS